MSTENPPTAPGRALVKGVETRFVKIFFFRCNIHPKKPKGNRKHPFCQAKTLQKKGTRAWKTTRSSPAVTPETAGARPSAVHLLQTNLPSFLCLQTGSAFPPPLVALGSLPGAGRGPPGRSEPGPEQRQLGERTGPPGQRGAGRGGRAAQTMEPARPHPARGGSAGLRGAGAAGMGGRQAGRGARCPPPPRRGCAARRGVTSLLCSAAAAGPHPAARAGLGSSRTSIPRARRGPGMPPQPSRVGAAAPASGQITREKPHTQSPGPAGAFAPAPRPSTAPELLRTCPPRDPQPPRPLGPSGPPAPRRPGAVPAIGVHARERSRGGHGGRAGPRQGLCTVTVPGREQTQITTPAATGDNCGRRPHRCAFLYIAQAPPTCGFLIGRFKRSRELLVHSDLPLSPLPRLPVCSEAPCLPAKSPLVKHYVCSAMIGCR